MYKPRFPIYIISKNRWNNRPTANMLEKMNLDYYIVVEQDQYEEYKKVVKGTVLVLPQEYLDNYDTFWPRDTDNRTGPGAARNFCWQHAIDSGFSHHWVLDDNIVSIQRFNNNVKVPCANGTPFYVMEDFVLRFKNIALAGPDYTIFCPYSECRPALRFNTRIYSCLLIDNSISFRWRGRYNEDTDLSLRVLKSGLVTVEFNCFLQEKLTTCKLKGGNTEEFYTKEGTLNKSQMLVDMHPDVTKLSNKFHRDHHEVNYKPFKHNVPIYKDDYIVNNKVNDFGMKLTSV